MHHELSQSSNVTAQKAFFTHSHQWVCLSAAETRQTTKKNPALVRGCFISPTLHSLALEAANLIINTCLKKLKMSDTPVIFSTVFCFITEDVTELWRKQKGNETRDDTSGDENEWRSTASWEGAANKIKERQQINPTQAKQDAHWSTQKIEDSGHENKTTVVALDQYEQRSELLNMGPFTHLTSTMDCQ